MTATLEDTMPVDLGDALPPASPSAPWDPAELDQLVRQCLAFGAALTGKTLFPYQLELAYRLIEAVLRNDGDTITALQSRQSGKTETLAFVIVTMMVLLPRLALVEKFAGRFAKYKGGFMVGVFAPVDSQAQTIFDRIVEFLRGKPAKEMFLDPEIDDQVEGGNGKLVTLKQSRSFCRMQTAHPKANIESKSYHFILIDECQTADEKMVNKSIRPMGAFYRAVKCYTGTTSEHKGVFFKAIQTNKRLQLERGGHRNHFEFDWRYCNPGEAPIWMGDFSFKPLRDVQVGDEIIGWGIREVESDYDRWGADRGLKRTRRTRQLMRGTVTAIQERQAAVYRVTMASGQVIRCTDDHRWLSGKSKTATSVAGIAGGVDYFVEPAVGRQLVRVIHPTPPLPVALERDASWLGGLWDGEGTCSRIAQSKDKNPAVYARIGAVLEALGIEYANDPMRHNMLGGRQTLVNFLNWCDPVKRATSTTSRDILRSRFMKETDEIVAMEFDGIETVYSMETTTGNYVAWGYASKNCARYNPDYLWSVRDDMTQMGEDSDEFQMAYCVAPETRILTADLRYVLAKHVHAGVRLVGFDEERPGPGQHRQFREAVVEEVGRIVRPVYRIKLSDGTVVRSSAEHQWLVSTAGRRTVWKTTEKLLPTDRIFKVADTWLGQHTYESGYLAAAFEGEGWLSTSRSGQLILGFAQRENVMLQQVRKYLDLHGFRYWEKTRHDGCSRLVLAGGRAAAVRFLGQIRPQRLLDKFDLSVLGSIGRHDHVGQEFEHPRVCSVEYEGEQEVIPIRTSTRTFVAEGLASHNCLKWPLEAGMFTSEEQLKELTDNSMEAVLQWHKSPLLAGLDVGKKVDSTVLTIIWVDPDYVDPYGYRDHRILNWLELKGDRWEEQYPKIVDFLANYSVVHMGIDGNGVGDVVAERLEKLLPGVTIEVLGADDSSQSKRWKHLMELMNRGLVSWPGGRNARRSKNFKRFIKQMEDLEKDYRRGNMIAAAPRAAGAHDDFPDSLAMGVWLTKSTSMPTVQTTQNVFYKKRRAA